jgi:hypothetical protein
MDFNRQWTQFALDAEVDHYGTGRIAKAHNELLAEVLRLRNGCVACELEATMAEAEAALVNARQYRRFALAEIVDVEPQLRVSDSSLLPNPQGRV